MKKITSAAALGLRLTLIHVLGLACVVGLFQWILFFLIGRDSTYTLAFEGILDQHPAFMGRLGMAGLMLVLYSAAAGDKRSKTVYTLRRLGISEGTLTLVWSAVFAGYFLLYWVFQVGMVVALLVRYAMEFGGGQNLMFVASFRSDYFHYLLPLYEPWGFGRNVLMCICFGSLAAQGARSARNGRWNPLCFGFVLMIFWAVLFPNEMASRGYDITLILIAVGCVVIDWIWTGRWMRNEAP